MPTLSRDPWGGFSDKRAEADFFREASVRLGISRDWLTAAARASRVLSGEEREVVTAFLNLVRVGIPTQSRSALLHGILSAIKTVQESSSDPLAEVDEPMDAAEAAEELVLAEAEAHAHREAILKECISVAEAAVLTGRSRQALERLRREGRLLALRRGSQWRYPNWQFDADAPGGILPGFGEALQNLDQSPIGAAFWFLQPYEQLGGSPPIDLLRRRRPEPVIQLAREHSYMP
jgi:hypothetical protein